MKIIAGFARGLNGLLGNFGYMGEGIKQLEESLRVVVDGQRFLGLARRITTYYPNTANMVVGFNALATVPKGKVWCLRTGAFGLDGVAASTCSVRIVVQTPGLVTGAAISEQLNVVATVSQSIPIVFPDLLLEPGSIIGAQFSNVVGGPWLFGSFTAVIEEYEA